MATRLNNARLDTLPRSMVSAHGLEYGLARTPSEQKLAVLGPAENASHRAFEGEQGELEHRILILCPVNHQNAQMLRLQLTWLQPKLLGLSTSAGMGDRIGIATPGHVRVVQELNGKVAPVFTQQSIREMQRTGRSPQQVLDDATWGIFEEGWLGGIGADADHLKSEADIDTCLAAHFKPHLQPFASSKDA